MNVAETNNTLSNEFIRAATRGRAGFVRRLWLSPPDRRLVSDILEIHAHRLSMATDFAAQTAIARTVIRPLNARARARAAASPLALTEEMPSTLSLAGVISHHPSLEKSRDIEGSQRILTGMSRWPLSWLRQPGVVCYERAAGRIRSERHGAIREDFVRSLVKTDVLPTAVASPSDHYVIVSPGKTPRFMTISENARCLWVQPDSPLLPTLNGDLVSPTQAVMALGRAVYAGIAWRLTRTLLQRGVVNKGLRYGSAFSGFDLFAEGVRVATGGDFNYAFASELDATIRAALLSTWGAYGLSSDNCHNDACCPAAKAAETVDLYVSTPPCERYSRRNHERSAEAQEKSLRVVWESLDYPPAKFSLV